MRAIDRTGAVIGRLTVIGMVRKGKHRAWECRCVCGNVVVVLGCNLCRAHTQSCGCLMVERTSSANTKHGATSRGKKSATFLSWVAMRKRCNNPTASGYERYGGRGISVCDRWSEFAKFLADMGEAPTGLTIDRIDNNGNYEPNNCRWATRTEQANNRRSSRFVEWGGRRQTINQWARELGVKRTTVALRLSKGWPLHRVFGA